MYNPQQIIQKDMTVDGKTDSKAVNRQCQDCLCQNPYYQDKWNTCNQAKTEYFYTSVILTCTYKLWTLWVGKISFILSKTFMGQCFDGTRYYSILVHTISFSCFKCKLYRQFTV